MDLNWICIIKLMRSLSGDSAGETALALWSFRRLGCIFEITLRILEAWLRSLDLHEPFLKLEVSCDLDPHIGDLIYIPELKEIGV